jgi:hypothetical protein
VALVAIRDIKLTIVVQNYKIHICVLFWGKKRFVQNSKVKICPTNFRPKWSFEESIPVALLLLGVAVPAEAARPLRGVEPEVCREGVVVDGVLPTVLAIPELEVALFQKAFVSRFLCRTGTKYFKIFQNISKFVDLEQNI